MDNDLALLFYLLGTAGLVFAAVGIGSTGGQSSGSWVLGFWSLILLLVGVFA